MACWLIQEAGTHVGAILPNSALEALRTASVASIAWRDACGLERARFRLALVVHLRVQGELHVSSCPAKWGFQPFTAAGRAFISRVLPANCTSSYFARLLNFFPCRLPCHAMRHHAPSDLAGASDTIFPRFRTLAPSRL